MSSSSEERVWALRSARIPALLVGVVSVVALAFGASLLGRAVTISCERSPAAACRLRADTWAIDGEETVIPLASIEAVRFRASVDHDTTPGARGARITSSPVFVLEDGETVGLSDYGHFGVEEKEAAAAALDAFLRSPERARVSVRYGGFAFGAFAALLVCFFLVPVALHFGVATLVVRADERALRAELYRGLFADESVTHPRRGRELVRVDATSGRVVVINGYDVATELPRLPWSRLPPCEIAARLRAALGTETE